MSVYAVTSTPVAARPVPETKSKSSKAAAQSASLPITKASVISSFQHTFAYLARAAVMNKSAHLAVVRCMYTGYCRRRASDRDGPSLSAVS